MRQHQLALQVLGKVLIGLRGVIIGPIGIAHQQPIIALTPVVLIVAIVMVTGFRYADLEEIRITEHRPGRGKSATGMPPDTDLIEIDKRISLRELLDTRDLIRQRVLGHIAIAHVMKTLGSVRITGTLDLHHDKTQFRQRLTIYPRSLETPVAY